MLPFQTTDEEFHVLRLLLQTAQETANRKNRPTCIEVRKGGTLHVCSYPSSTGAALEVVTPVKRIAGGGRNKSRKGIDKHYQR